MLVRTGPCDFGPGAAEVREPGAEAVDAVGAARADADERGGAGLVRRPAEQAARSNDATAIQSARRLAFISPQ